MFDKLISIFFEKKTVDKKSLNILPKVNRVYDDGYKRFTLNEQNKNRPLNKYFKDLKGLKNRNKEVICSLYSRKESPRFFPTCR